MKLIQYNLYGFGIPNKLPESDLKNNESTPLSLKKLRMITMWLVCNGCHLIVYSIKKKQQTHRTSRWAQQIDCPITQAMRKDAKYTILNASAPKATQPMFHGQELCASIIHYPLSGSQVQLEGYLGLMVTHPTYCHNHISL